MKSLAGVYLVVIVAITMRVRDGQFSKHDHVFTGLCLLGVFVLIALQDQYFRIARLERELAKSRKSPPS